jgi:hypothetical protein
MTSRLTVDKLGNVALPKPLCKKREIWAFRAGEPLSAKTVSTAVAEVRRERDQDSFGGHIGPRSTRRKAR